MCSCHRHTKHAHSFRKAHKKTLSKDFVRINKYDLWKLSYIAPLFLVHPNFPTFTPVNGTGAFERTLPQHYTQQPVKHRTATSLSVVSLVAQSKPFGFYIVAVWIVLGLCVQKLLYCWVSVAHLTVWLAMRVLMGGNMEVHNFPGWETKKRCGVSTPRPLQKCR